MTKITGAPDTKITHAGVSFDYGAAGSIEITNCSKVEKRELHKLTLGDRTVYIILVEYTSKDVPRGPEDHLPLGLLCKQEKQNNEVLDIHKEYMQ